MMSRCLTTTTRLSPDAVRARVTISAPGRKERPGRGRRGVGLRGERSPYGFFFGRGLRGWRGIGSHEMTGPCLR